MRFPYFVALLTGAALATAPFESAFAQKKGAAPEPPSLTKTYPEELTEVLPDFAGGPKELQRFLFAHLVVPPFALANQLAGSVDVEFVLRPDGQMDSIRVSNGACCGLDEEALRVARLTAGKWKPGQIAGVAVNTRVDLPITFRVANKNSRSLAYFQEMKTKYANYQGSADQTKDQQTYQQEVNKQTTP